MIFTSFFKPLIKIRLMRNYQNRSFFFGSDGFADNKEKSRHRQNENHQADNTRKNDSYCNYMVAVSGSDGNDSGNNGGGTRCSRGGSDQGSGVSSNAR